ncbi:MAG TPA: PLDc N-terminal domain-containing protein [bacterium]|jgi:hypothetical protein|nr:PLDc N-terminal domain-containing protein [bacterium]HXC64762.1 PLDc N-terminal domain-containing protein [bacterium]
MYSLFGLVILVLDIWAIVQIVSSKDDNLKKLLWVLLILLLPVVGLLLWYFLARK